MIYSYKEYTKSVFLWDIDGGENAGTKMIFVFTEFLSEHSFIVIYLKTNDNGFTDLVLVDHFMCRCYKLDFQKTASK